MTHKTQIYTARGLAVHLGISYQSVRRALRRYHKGEISNFKGFKFFGEWNKVWYAYPEDADIEIVDAPAVP